MYYVYKIELKGFNAVYFGCTNNIIRRKNQHNENARKNKGYFGQFLSRSNIVLAKKDFLILAEYADRHTALMREREEVKKANKSGVQILNDNYSEHCSRVGLKGSTNPNSKKYIVVDMINKTFEEVEDMHEHSCKLSVKYKNLIGTVQRKPKACKGRYVARYKEEWQEMSETEKNNLISGEWYKQELAKSNAILKQKRAKKYLVQTPNGDTIEVSNLDEFARNNGINSGNLHASFSKNKTASGYKVIHKF